MAKPRTVRNLKPDDPLATSLPKILITRFREIISYAEGALEGEDNEALHNLRVSTRRLHSLLKLFKNYFPKKTFTIELKNIRALLRAMGTVREEDVFIMMLEEHCALLPPADRKAIEPLLIQHRHRREIYRNELPTSLAILHNPSYVKRYEQFVHSLGNFSPSDIHRRMQKSLRQNGRLILPAMFDECMSYRKIVLRDQQYHLQLHSMRIQEKELRYAMEIFQSSFGKEFRACLRKLKKMLDLMGYIHDYDIAISNVKKYAKEVKQASGETDRHSLPALKSLLRHQGEIRTKYYIEMCVILKQWKRQNFRQQLITSMKIV